MVFNGVGRAANPPPSEATLFVPREVIRQTSGSIAYPAGIIYYNHPGVGAPLSPPPPFGEHVAVLAAGRLIVGEVSALELFAVRDAAVIMAAFINHARAQSHAIHTCMLNRRAFYDLLSRTCRMQSFIPFGGPLRTDGLAFRAHHCASLALLARINLRPHTGHREDSKSLASLRAHLA